MCQTAIGLTWRYFVRQLVLASETAFDQGTLAIDKAALLQAIAEPYAIREIDIQVTHPGESCRIVHVLDAVGPMVKVRDGRRPIQDSSERPSLPGTANASLARYGSAGVWHVSGAYQRGTLSTTRPSSI